MAIYFIQNETNKAIKIGFASDVESRRRALQTASPDRLILLGSIEGDMARERELHREFADLRLVGEWFRPSPKLMDRIRWLTRKPAVLCRREIRSVYLAGKVAGTTWRDALTGGQWSREGTSSAGAIGYDDPWWTHEDAVALPDGRTLDLTGPFWRMLGECGDGWMRGSGGLHANGQYGGDHGCYVVTNPEFLAEQIALTIDQSHLVFAWLDTRESYGTLVELGYARARATYDAANGVGGWPIVVVACPKWDRELWLAYQMAHKFIVAPTPEEAWRRLWADPAAFDSYAETDEEWAYANDDSETILRAGEKCVNAYIESAF